MRMNIRYFVEKAKKSIFSPLGAWKWKGGHKKGGKRGGSHLQHWLRLKISPYEALISFFEVKSVFFYRITFAGKLSRSAPPLPPLFQNFHFSKNYSPGFHQNQKSSSYDNYFRTCSLLKSKNSFFEGNWKNEGLESYLEVPKNRWFLELRAHIQTDINCDPKMIWISFLVQNVRDATLFIIRQFLKRGAKGGGQTCVEKLMQNWKTSKTEDFPIFYRTVSVYLYICPPFQVPPLFGGQNRKKGGARCDRKRGGQPGSLLISRSFQALYR